MNQADDSNDVADQYEVSTNSFTDSHKKMSYRSVV